MKLLRNLIIILALLTFFAGIVFADTPAKTYIDNTKIDTISIVKMVTAYLPVTVLKSKLKANIEYKEGSDSAKVNNTPVKVTSFTKDGESYISVKPIITFLGGYVEYDKAAKAVCIFTKPYAATKPIQVDRSNTIKIKPVQETETIVVKKPGTTLEEKPKPQETQAQAKPADDKTKPFMPRGASNGIFTLTVTNAETASTVKGNLRAHDGFKFFVVHFTLKNVSTQLQTYLGKFTLIDDGNNSYQWVSGLSNYWIVYMRPGGINYSYFVFELPVFAMPKTLFLDLGGKKPSLSVSVEKALRQEDMY